MLVTFSTQAYADITMFGDIAVGMLKKMGLSGTVPSALLAADIPAALNLLTGAINSEHSAHPAQNPDTDEPHVSMANRAIPLIDLLKAAVKANADVMWK